AVAGAAAIGALTAPAALAAQPSHHSHGSRSAVFVQTDDTAHNSVVAYRAAPDGRLTETGRYATGGRGGILPGSVVDHTASQGAVTYDARHRLLYVVNAGSNTVTVFAVHGTELRRVQVIGSGGTFPVSVSVYGDLVYVLNAQNGGTIQGFLARDGQLLRIANWRRPLGLDSTQTAFTETPGQVTFTPDGRDLLVTTKANGNSIDVFAVDRFGAPAKTPVQNVRAGAVPFALAFGPGS